MKKILSIFSIIAFTISAYGQGLKPVKLDSLVTISMPAEHTMKDTAGQKIFSGNGNLGYMMVIRAENKDNNEPLKKEKDLNNVFNDYMKKIQGQSDGSILNSRDTTIGNLKAKVFALESQGTEGPETRNFTVIYTKEATYTFEYVYPNGRKELVKDENKAFFSSINVSPELQRTDQYTNTTASSTGVSKIIIFGGGAVVLLLAGYFVFRKKTETSLS